MMNRRRFLLTSLAGVVERTEDEMESAKKVSLCPACKACPEVEVIGELVDLIQSGQLSRL